MAALPQFQIRWRDVTEVAQAITTGMTEEEAAAVSRLDRPLLVFIYDENADVDGDPRFEIEQHKAFQDDQVVIGARFFDCVRIDKTSAAKDRVLKPYARRSPSLVFVRPDLSAFKALKGKFSARSVYSAMCATMQKDYQNCVRTAVKKQRALQKELLKVNKMRVEVVTLNERIDDTESTRKRAKLVKERDALEKEIGVAEGRLNEREGAIYELKPRKTT